MIAALYVQTGGAYYGIEGVDPWDVVRDARGYEGPAPVVAHPPCDRWSIMSLCRGHRDGADGGCFESALAAVRQWGGVLEHPARSLAWDRYGLPTPTRSGWTRSFSDEGWTTEVDQGVYGLAFRKRTWLYYVGDIAPPAMNWRRSVDLPGVARYHRAGGRSDTAGLTRQGVRSVSPPAFRDALIDLARGARHASPVT